MSVHEMDHTAAEQLSEDALANTPSEVLELLTSLQSEVKKLREDLVDYKKFAGKEIHEIRQKVNSSEESGEDASSEENPRSEEGESTTNASPLEQIAALDEDTARKELSANQFRARTVAKNVNSLAKKCPKGRVLTSTDIRKVIAVEEGETPHTETISRVVRFLQRFDNRISVVKRRGKRRIVFPEGFNHTSGGSANEGGGTNSVILSG